MSLRTTPEAGKWLEQFDAVDRALAEQLIDSLLLISPNRFRCDLIGLVENIETDSSGPIALYAARETNTPYFKDKRRSPQQTEPSTEVGSEGQIAQIITNLDRLDKRFMSHPAIGALRRFRCHDVVILDDVVSSGQRIEGFLSRFVEIDTIRSWRSFGWITFHIAAYAISYSGEQRVRTYLSNRKSHPSCKGVQFHYVQRMPSISNPWTEEQERSLRELCRTYGKRGGIKPADWEGHQRSMATIIFEHGCPNNAPGILWSKTKRWKPLFPNRAIPPSLIKLFNDDQPQGILATPFAQLIRADSTHIHRAVGQAGTDFLLVLSAVAKKLRTKNDVADATGLSTKTAGKMLELARECGLVDQANVLTAQGKSELRHARTLGNLPEEPPALQDTPYFPTALRAARRTS